MCRIKRGNVYRLAFWILIRKFSVIEFKEALDILRQACSNEDLDVEEFKFILNETIDSYLRRNYVRNNF